MIILVTASSRSQECAAAIERKTHQETLIAASPAAAVEFMQGQDAEALVIDESWQQVENTIDKLVEAHAVTATPIYVNLSLHSAERVALQVSCALQRMQRERSVSMRAAASELHSELRGEVTAILLNAELVLHDRELAAGAAEKVRAVQEAAVRMRRRLDGPRNQAKSVPLKPQLVGKPTASGATR